jgi:hypothetical protein
VSAFSVSISVNTTAAPGVEASSSVIVPVTLQTGLQLPKSKKMLAKASEKMIFFIMVYNNVFDFNMSSATQM